MSNYTTELRFICETYAGLLDSEGYGSVNTIIENSRSKIFDFDYPIFDRNYKKTLETKILKHYYTREICAETVARWKLFLDTRMNEIMPKYNKLYESELLQFNPFYDADYTRSGDKNTDYTLDETQSTTTDNTDVVTDNTTTQVTLGGEDSRNINTTLDGSDVTNANTELGGSDRTHRENTPVIDQWTYYNDTPQGGVNGMTLSNNSYLTNATHVTSTGAGSEDDSTTTYGRTDDSTTTTDYGKISRTTDTTDYGQTSTTKNTGTTTDKQDGVVNTDKDSSANTTEDYAEHVIGKFPGKSYSKLLQEFRETFLNIDLMVINELNDLFFALWE